jgi:hypothetical protein
LLEEKKMSLNAKDRSQDNHGRPTSYPSSHDWPGADEERSVSKGHTTEPEDDLLVEHILDFLDKYPACFTPHAPLTKYLRAC